MRTTIVVKQVFRNIRNQMFLFENLFNDIQVDLNKEYVLELREIRSQRTLQQNKYMWALIHAIANHDDVNQDEVDIYTFSLEEAKANYIYLLGTPEAESELRKNFRAVRVVRPTEEKGKKFIIYKCFIGTSKMDTKQMNKVLDVIIAWAEKLGIETDEKYYSN